MAALGFTTVGSLLKDQSEYVKAKGIEAYGVSMVDDSNGKHDIIKSSNAQLHLFMQIKRCNVTHIILQTSEQAEAFFDNIAVYYGKEKAEKVLSTVDFMVLGDAGDVVKSHGFDRIQVFETFEGAIDAYPAS